MCTVYMYMSHVTLHSHMGHQIFKRLQEQNGGSSGEWSIWTSSDSEDTSTTCLTQSTFVPEARHRVRPMPTPYKHSHSHNPDLNWLTAWTQDVKCKL